MCVFWLVNVFGVTQAEVGHVSSIRVTRFIHWCNLTGAHVHSFLITNFGFVFICGCDIPVWLMYECDTIDSEAQCGTAYSCVRQDWCIRITRLCCNHTLTRAIICNCQIPVDSLLHVKYICAGVIYTHICMIQLSYMCHMNVSRIHVWCVTYTWVIYTDVYFDSVISATRPNIMWHVSSTFFYPPSPELYEARSIESHTTIWLHVRVNASCQTRELRTVRVTTDTSHDWYKSRTVRVTIHRVMHYHMTAHTSQCIMSNTCATNNTSHEWYKSRIIRVTNYTSHDPSRHALQCDYILEWIRPGLDGFTCVTYTWLIYTYLYYVYPVCNIYMRDLHICVLRIHIN